MKFVKRALPVCLVFTMLFCTFFSLSTVSASAATTSSGTQTRTITVQTKANYWIPGAESITIGQTKGVLQKRNGKTCNEYGMWNISVRATDGSDSYKKNLTDGSIKLKLKPNKTYVITISWDSGSETIKNVGGKHYTKYPTWKVKSTWKVSNYY